MDFTVRNIADAVSILSTITNALTLFLTAMAAVALIVGGIGILNIMMATVGERTREIGLRKAVGATNCRHPQPIFTGSRHPDQLGRSGRE